MLCTRFFSAPIFGHLSRTESSRGISIVGFLGLGLLSVVLAAPAQAVPTITLGGGVANPPPNKQSTSLNPQQTAIADKATLIPVATFSPALQGLLTAQQFSAANNWSLNTNTVTLANNATFNITDYELTLNGAGNAFGEEMDFTLNPALAAPMNVPAGSTVTAHWLQFFNMSMNKANGYAGTQLAAPNNTGYWYIDNGFVPGVKVDGTNNGAGTNNGHNGPYYDSNNVPADSGKTYSVPPTFSDGPGFFSGVGFYIHFEAIPTWDVYTPAGGGNPATDTIYVGNYGVGWGFSIVPEPCSIVMMFFGAVGMLVVVVRRRHA
ncbi:MAG TPA: PEP-CTERM sorting domain-containing protein [Pirellulales bacterium]|nr:PEP-CTERM sorting domain-containing protein [Pirellulales bacterium]